jgi:serine protease
MEGSPSTTPRTGELFRCNANDGLGSPGDCAGASGKVCLISRGTYSFAEKVNECSSNNGVAAIIFNSDDSLFSGTLGGVTTTIPSVGVSGATGSALMTLIASTTATAAVQTTSGGNYAFYDGTSMACPHVSGVAARVWSQAPTCTNDQVRSACLPLLRLLKL